MQEFVSFLRNCIQAPDRCRLLVPVPPRGREETHTSQRHWEGQTIPRFSWGMNSFCPLSQCCTVNPSIHPSHLEHGLSSLICYPRNCPTCLRRARKRDFPLLPRNGCSSSQPASSKEHRRIQVSHRPAEISASSSFLLAWPAPFPNMLL